MFDNLHSFMLMFRKPNFVYFELQKGDTNLLRI